jgi:hypothetical protein
MKSFLGINLFDLSGIDPFSGYFFFKRLPDVRGRFWQSRSCTGLKS